MRHLFFISFLLLSIISCKKEYSTANSIDPLLNNIKTTLRDSLSEYDYANLDFRNIYLSRIKDSNIQLIRISFINKKMANDFILVQLNEEGTIARGRIIHLEEDIKSTATGLSDSYSFVGSISIFTLNRKLIIHSEIKNGFIAAFHPTPNYMRADFLEPVQPYIPVLPDVIVYSYTSPKGISVAYWYYLLGLFGGSSTGSTGYYNPSNPYYGSGGSDGGDSGSGYGGSTVNSTIGGTGGGGYSIVIDNPVEIEAEYIYDLVGVNLSKMLKCFDNVPSVGATYKIKLCSDIPSNNRPDASASFSAVSGGHSFLTITKANGSMSVTQSFGFYPKQAPSFWDPFAPVASEIRDNGFQEINASIEMSVTESQFNTIMQKALFWTSKNYELADYNCSNYAIDIFNSIRSHPLMIAGYQIILPVSTNPWAPTNPITVTFGKSPQMLFQKLQEMKNNNDPEATNILIDQSHNLRAPVSKGECN